MKHFSMSNLHCLQDVLHPHPLPPCISRPSLACLRPDLIKAWNYEGASKRNNESFSNLCLNDLTFQLAK